ncbi:DeoR/GlpR family DNA-binding transcription regulator [Streptococcus caprae]|uniref:DeoR/GlpR family DNA-binding transcription regulator n=1 Tax=Streptococcus caprae TaxID=1640501 RepID=A0ABV8CYD3_9STRE
MLKSERKRFITDKIREENTVSLEELTNLLETSESTIRRDLDELESENKLRRVHGGAERIASLQEELSNQEKSIKNVQEKMAIAKEALAQIDEGDVVFIDAGTTTELLVRELTFKQVTVVTNSIHHASKLVERGIQTIIIGGFVKQSTDASVGQLAVEQIKRLNFDKAFLGMNGVDENFFTTPDLEEAVIKQLIIENARKAYVLVDNTKLSQTSFVKVTGIEKASVITNKSLNVLTKNLKEKTEVMEV